MGSTADPLNRKLAKRNTAISSLSAHGKYLVSCSADDNLVIVYDHSKREEYSEIALEKMNPDNGVIEGDLPSTAILFKDHGFTNQEFLLIGSTKGQIYLYDLENRLFGTQINMQANDKKVLPGKLSIKSQQKIIQIKKLGHHDKISKDSNIFAALSQSGQLKLFAIRLNRSRAEDQ